MIVDGSSFPTAPIAVATTSEDMAVALSGSPSASTPYSTSPLVNDSMKQKQSEKSLLNIDTTSQENSIGEKGLDKEINLLRIVAYVCMTPTSMASKEVLMCRRLAFIHNESTSHWPHKFHSAGGRACAHYLPKRNIHVDWTSIHQYAVYAAGTETDTATVADANTDDVSLSASKYRFQLDPREKITAGQRDLIDGNGLTSNDWDMLIKEYVPFSLSNCVLS